jgi:hypothetical protein
VICHQNWVPQSGKCHMSLATLSETAKEML